jgi:L-lysine 2,3-aminomutase
MSASNNDIGRRDGAIAPLDIISGIINVINMKPLKIWLITHINGAQNTDAIVKKIYNVNIMTKIKPT